MNKEETSSSLSAALTGAMDAGPVPQEVLDYFDVELELVAGVPGEGPDPLAEVGTDGGSAPEELLAEINNAVVSGEEPASSGADRVEEAIDAGGPLQEIFEALEAGEAMPDQDQDLMTGELPKPEWAADDGCCP